jgi:hypothetical protein
VKPTKRRFTCSLISCARLISATAECSDQRRIGPTISFLPSQESQPLSLVVIFASSELTASRTTYCRAEDPWAALAALADGGSPTERARFGGYRPREGGRTASRIAGVSQPAPRSRSRSGACCPAIPVGTLPMWRAARRNIVTSSRGATRITWKPTSACIMAMPSSRGRYPFEASPALGHRTGLTQAVTSPLQF